MNIETSIKTWFSSRRHVEDPFSEAELTVFAEITINGTQVATGFSTRPLAELLPLRTFGELKNSAIWEEMVQEAKGKAGAGLDAIVHAAKGVRAA